VKGTFPDLPEPATSNRVVFVLVDASCKVVEHSFRVGIIRFNATNREKWVRAERGGEFVGVGKEMG
jgi:hypothetical protein